MGRNMDRKRDLREGIEDADATGMVAAEESITQAETLLPLVRLREALPEGHAARATVDALHSEIGKPAPNRQAIATHVGRLRSLRELEAEVANWWDDPLTQRFVAYLNQIGL